MDWVHCNACYNQPFEVKIQFHLTNCGHIFCESCIKQAPGYCQVCKQKCSCILLSNKMKSDVERFFTSPKDMFKQIMQVLEFQDGHRQRLLKHRMAKVLADGNNGINEQQTPGKSELQREFQRLKEENSQLKHVITAMRSKQRDYSSQSRGSTPYQTVMQSPMQKAPGSQLSMDQRFATMSSSNHQQSATPGHTPGTVLSQTKTRTPSDRISIRTPPVGGVISTPSPCKIYKLTSNSAYPRIQQRPQHEQGMHRPNSSILRARSNTPSSTPSYSRPSSPCVSSSPRENSSLMRTSQKYHIPGESTPGNTPSSKTPYTSRPESSSPMHINSTLDPNQRQIRLSYQPRTALAPKLSTRPSSSQQPP